MLASLVLLAAGSAVDGREDGIPNRVWKVLAALCESFIPIITRIFNACMRTGYNPRCF